MKCLRRSGNAPFAEGFFYYTEKSRVAQKGDGAYSMKPRVELGPVAPSELWEEARCIGSCAGALPTPETGQANSSLNLVRFRLLGFNQECEVIRDFDGIERTACSRTVQTPPHPLYPPQSRHQLLDQHARGKTNGNRTCKPPVV